MRNLAFELFEKLISLPIWLQLLIVISVYFIFFVCLFYLSRLIDIGIFGSKREYYKSQDPLTKKKILKDALWCTSLATGSYVITFVL